MRYNFISQKYITFTRIKLPTDLYSIWPPHTKSPQIYSDKHHSKGWSQLKSKMFNIFNISSSFSFGWFIRNTNHIYLYSRVETLRNFIIKKRQQSTFLKLNQGKTRGHSSLGSYITLFTRKRPSGLVQLQVDPPLSKIKCGTQRTFKINKGLSTNMYGGT